MKLVIGVTFGLIRAWACGSTWQGIKPGVGEQGNIVYLLQTATLFTELVDDTASVHAWKCSQSALPHIKSFNLAFLKAHVVSMWPPLGLTLKSLQWEQWVPDVQLFSCCCLRLILSAVQGFANQDHLISNPFLPRKKVLHLCNSDWVEFVGRLHSVGVVTWKFCAC